MLGILNELWITFLLGLATPLTAVCVLPLYPGYLSYLASTFNDTSDEKQAWHIGISGVLASLGVVTFFLTVGLVFTTLLQRSLTTAVETVSPIAFGILALVSIVLLLDIDIGFSFHPQTPNPSNPYLNAFLYGFFFGAIVLPCNPGFIAAFLARSLLIQSPAVNLLNVGVFGIGIGTPLIVLALLSARWSSQVIRFFSAHNTAINRTAGAIMLAVSIYYLFFVFTIV